MEVDTATSATQAPTKHSLPELEIYSCLLVLIFLIDQKRYNEVYFLSPHIFVYSDIVLNVKDYLPVVLQAKACASAGIGRLKNYNKRTLDVLTSRLYFYYSLSYELTGDLAEIRGLVMIFTCYCIYFIPLV